LRISKQGQSFITESNNKMDSRGSSIIGRVSSSDDSTCNQDEFNNSNQSYQNHFLDDLRKNQGMENPIHDTKDQVNPEMEATNIFFGIPKTLGINQDEKESDNDDVVYIQSTKDSINNNATEGSKTANNPFRFGTNTESNANDTQHSKTMTKSQISQDSASITINTITDLLKQLQQLTDKEKEILKSREENVSDNSTKAENRKRSRPQLLMKKMKCILSSSNLGIKNDNHNDNVTSSQNDSQNNQMINPEVESLDNLREKKLFMAKESLNAVDRLRGDITQHMPGVVRRRANQCSSVSPSPSINGLSQDDELPLLLGRCFNLSVNMKILRQCNYADPAIGCRVFVDFDVLENYLHRKIKESEMSLNIQPSITVEKTLCPRQLENQIHALTIKNEDLCR